MQKGDKVGYETLRSKYDVLTSTLHPNDLLPHFFAKRLISSVQKEEIECATKEHGRNRGCEKLLDTLLTNGREGAFQTFLEILRDHPHLDYLVRQLQQEYDKHYQDSFQEQATRDEAVSKCGSANLDEKKVAELIDEKMKDLQIPREKIFPYPVEEIKFLEILQKLGELKEVSHLVASCEVLVTEQCVKLVGTPEATRQAKTEIDQILEHAAQDTEYLPEFVSSQIVGEHAAKCMEMNKGVLVLPEERKMKFIAKSTESCKKAKEWLQAHAYPAALEFTAGKEIFGRYVYTSSRLHGRRPVPVRVKAVPEAFCAEYLHPPDHDPRTPLFFTMELPKKTAAATLISFKHNLSWCSDSIRWKLKSVFEKVQPYRANFKVGYEARFGHVFWKLGGLDAQRDGPGNEAAGKQWTLDQFTHPHFLHSRFFVRVHPDIHELLSTYTDDLHLSVKLLDPLKLEVTRRDDTKVDCVAVIEELRDGRFILNNVYYDWNSRGKPKFDIVLPEKKYDVRIAPCFDSVVEQDCDAEVREIADHFKNTIHRRSDGTLWMKVRGPNYRLKFVRQKEQTQHRWRANKKWILAVYHVQEFGILVGEIDKWPLNKEVTVPLKKPKTEIELWNQKMFGDFASHANFSKSEYEAVKSTKDMWLPGEDTPRKGSLWTAEEMMEDFEDFIATAVDIADLLTATEARGLGFY